MYSSIHELANHFKFPIYIRIDEAEDAITL